MINDELSLQPVDKRLQHTKRGILSFMSTIYDPHGVVVPFVLEVKLLLQELWRLKIGWDEEIPKHLLTRFLKWSSLVPKISEVHIPRWFGCTNLSSETVQLHLFADASTKAYGAVAYLRVENQGTVTITFVMGRSRLAPMKIITIPKLELQAAVIAVRLKEAISNSISIDINETIFWTDSVTVLKYIRNTDTRFSAFVMHRVNEIKTYSMIKEWRHVPGDLNVADESTRPTLLIHSADSKWLSGPSFLQDVNLPIFESLGNASTPDEEQSQVNAIRNQVALCIPWERFSSWHHFVRLMAFIIKLKNHWINYKRKKTRENFDAHLKTKEILESEHSLLRLVQKETFPTEYQRLSANQEIKHSSVLPLRPILWKGLLRVGGRIKHAEVPFETKHQIILSHKHPASKLILDNIHQRNMHAGVNHLVCLSRNTYWITHIKTLSKQVVRACQHCRRLNV